MKILNGANVVKKVLELKFKALVHRLHAWKDNVNGVVGWYLIMRMSIRREWNGQIMTSTSSIGCGSLGVWQKRRKYWCLPCSMTKPHAMHSRSYFRRHTRQWMLLAFLKYNSKLFHSKARDCRWRYTWKIYRRLLISVKEFLYICAIEHTGKINCAYVGCCRSLTYQECAVSVTP